MKIQRVALEDFMLFDQLQVDFSPHINIISGENSTGKTALLKLLYTCAFCNMEKRQDQLRYEEAGTKGYSTLLRNDEYILLPKLEGVYGPDISAIELISSKSKGPAKVSLSFYDCGKPFSFSLYQDSPPKIEIPDSGLEASDVVFIPTKEMISATEHYASLYKRYHINFDETYYDLASLLDSPRKKELSEKKLTEVSAQLERWIGGKLLCEGKTFYLETSQGKMNMKLVSEGYRKFATLLNLVSTGTLMNGTILFWDEPETNLNPKMTRSLVSVLVSLAAAGVQVFVTTHDYFVQQYFGLAAEYGEKYQPGNGNLQYRFFSLDRDGEHQEEAEHSREPGGVSIDWASQLENLKHNAVSEEYDALYDREMGLLYDNNAE